MGTQDPTLKKVSEKMPWIRLPSSEVDTAHSEKGMFLLVTEDKPSSVETSMVIFNLVCWV